MSTPWRLLNQTTPESELPPLLLSTTFTSNSYKISVTDLTYLWTESLDRRGIIKRSFDKDTSIDPSEDAEQLRVFLDKIHSGLSGGENTTLSIQAKSSPKSADPPNLFLFLTAKLPRGLRPLEWSMQLNLSPQSELSSRLTIPIIRAQNARMRELNKLVELLKDKDHVIQKLVDKLETTGAELGHVFPGASGKGGRRIPRMLAEERVKGLGIFDVRDWKKKMKVKGEESSHQSVQAAVKEVFEGETLLELDPIAHSETPGGWLNWWDRLKDKPLEFSNGAGAPTKNSGPAKALIIREKSKSPVKDDDDDFQVQLTPPQITKSHPKDADTDSSPQTISSQRVIENSTDDDDDLNAPSQRSIVPDSVPLSSTKTPRKLGAIGHPILSPPPKPLIVAQSPIPQDKIGGKHAIIDDDETASEDEGGQSPAKSPTPPKPELPPPPPKAKKGGLGRIGGKAREATPPAIRAAEKSTSPDGKPRHKLGVIGHKSKTPEADKASGQEQEGGAWRRRGNSEEQDEGPRETPRERADRKREELKSALEEKAKSPVKKKRKF